MTNKEKKEVINKICEIIKSEIIVEDIPDHCTEEDIISYCNKVCSRTFYMNKIH
jgi:mannitol/fructose-specific phosphotransferase system IIA component (Ntr-type)